MGVIASYIGGAIFKAFWYILADILGWATSRKKESPGDLVAAYQAQREEEL